MNKSKSITNLFSKMALLFIVFSCNKLIEETKVGDVFVVALEDNSYTTWKITKVEPDKIWYICNDYNVSDQSLVDAINSVENYTDSPKYIIKTKFYKQQNNKLKNPIKQ